MKQTSGPAKKLAEAVIKDIRRATRRQFSSEEKIRVVLEGLRGEDSRRASVITSLAALTRTKPTSASSSALAGPTPARRKTTATRHVHAEPNCSFFAKSIALVTRLQPVTGARTDMRIHLNI